MYSTLAGGTFRRLVQYTVESEVDSVSLFAGEQRDLPGHNLLHFSSCLFFCIDAKGLYIIYLVVFFFMVAPPPSSTSVPSGSFPVGAL